MGLVSSLLGTKNRPEPGDYVELTADNMDKTPSVNTQVCIANLDGQATAMEVKDAITDGNIVIADITRLKANSSSTHIIDDLDRIATEIGGDIVQKGESELIITPPGIQISRTKIGE